jgi:hypothetical protein
MPAGASSLLRLLRHQWRARARPARPHVVAYWETQTLRRHHIRLTNAANLVINNVKRLGFGFRNVENYRPRLLLRALSHQYDPANHASVHSTGLRWETVV